MTLIAVLLFFACTDELNIGVGNEESLSDELPLEFNFLLPYETGSRAFSEDDNVKTKFSQGDVIHVLGTFQTQNLQEDGTYEPGPTITRYGALIYNGLMWNAVAGSNLTWPTNAINGEFKAYFISESNGVLTGENPTETYLLSDLTPSSDPLMARSDTEIPYGYGIRMQFSHICTYLSLVDLEPMVAENYWFTTNKVKESESGSVIPFNNAFRISLSNLENPTGPDLNFEFCAIGNPQYQNMVYISANSIQTEGVDENGNPIVTAQANYFLEPGYYESFTLVYPAGVGSTYSYLEYDYTNVPTESGGVGITNNPPDLKANQTYTLTITKSPGITVNIPPQAGGWDESGTSYDVDVEDFLKAIYEGNNYFYEDDAETIQIIEKTPTGTKLLHNVNFNFKDYSEFNDQSFRPNNQEGSVFDGDYHYISNLGSPLFRYNYGTIQNLGVKWANISLVSYEDSNENDDMSRNGALCMWNRSNATITNVRISNVDLKVYVKTVDAGGQETHNIGGVVGSNTGVINGVSIAGNFYITVAGLEANTPEFGNGMSYPVNSSVLIGGFLGQNAGEGEVYDVSPQEGSPVINVTNNCIGPLGAFSLGGVVGESQGYITGVILPNVRVNSSSSSGVTSYIGGIAGQLAVSTGSENAVLNSCVVSGSVRAGVSQPSAGNAISSVSYIGGIAGTVLNVPVVDCSSAVSVYATTQPKENVTYGTGGAIGRIRQSASYNIRNIIAYGTELQYPSTTVNNWYGNFAGIVPAGQSWDDNYSDKNIIVHIFSDMEYIGGAFD
ncbi:MAG: hypothetical protein J1F38_10190 [Muribaculaceae bacterium]|nr:hypothetical protein [Muribaculaceae bacterium]